MVKNRDILEREDLHRPPYGVPEGYFDQLKERLGAIPQQQEALSGLSSQRLASAPDRPLSAADETAGARRRFGIRTALGWAAGIAAALALGVFAFRGSDSLFGPGPGEGGVSALSVSGMPSYEQFALADLIPRTDPYIYYAEESAAAADPAEEEMIDYLLQYQNY